METILDFLPASFMSIVGAFPVVHYLYLSKKSRDEASKKLFMAQAISWGFLDITWILFALGHSDQDVFRFNARLSLLFLAISSVIKSLLEINDWLAEKWIEWRNGTS